MEREVLTKSSAWPFSIPGPRAAAIVIGVLVALKLAFLFVLAWNTRFVMDEFVQFGWAKYLGNGLFETIWPAKAAGFAFFYKLAHLIGWNAVSTLLIGRIQTALLACGTVALVFACARALGENRTRALAIVLALLAFSNFMERIFRTIAEPQAVFFAVASLLVILRARSLRPRAILLAGVLTGLAFLATQKSVYFNLALGLALVGDAALARRYTLGIRRGAWLVLGWTVPLIAYCLYFGGSDPLPIAESLFFGPGDIVGRGGADYGGLRHFVVQILVRNLVLCALCFAGMLLSLRRVRELPEGRRIALIFSLVITVLVFAHDQPWPYVFIMALPFMALWVLEPLDFLAGNRAGQRIAWIALAFAVIVSFVANVRYLRIDNPAQLKLVARAEALLNPNEKYFDAIGMLPNRAEPSTLWLDRHYILATLRDRENSDAYRILAETPPKIIIWSYRMDGIEPVVAPLIRDSYVRVAPNIRLAGQRLSRGERVSFDVPVAGTYRLYDSIGRPVRGRVDVDGTVLDSRFPLTRGRKSLILRSGPGDALLIPEGSYAGSFEPGDDNPDLFAGVYA